MQLNFILNTSTYNTSIHAPLLFPYFTTPSYGPCELTAYKRFEINSSASPLNRVSLHVLTIAMGPTFRGNPVLVMPVVASFLRAVIPPFIKKNFIIKIIKPPKPQFIKTTNAV